jgi:hypothetical protein
MKNRRVGHITLVLHFCWLCSPDVDLMFAAEWLHAVLEPCKQSSAAQLDVFGLTGYTGEACRLFLIRWRGTIRHEGKPPADPAVLLDIAACKAQSTLPHRCEAAPKKCPHCEKPLAVGRPSFVTPMLYSTEGPLLVRMYRKQCLECKHLCHSAFSTSNHHTLTCRSCPCRTQPTACSTG